MEAADTGASRRDVRSSDRSPPSLRYRGEMRKSKTPKLVVRRETLRALASVELTRAVGGNAEEAAESGAATCPFAGIKAPPPAG